MTAKNTHRADCELQKGHKICHCVCLIVEGQARSELDVVAQQLAEELEDAKSQVAVFNEAVNVAQAKQARLEAALMAIASRNPRTNDEQGWASCARERGRIAREAMGIE